MIAAPRAGRDGVGFAFCVLRFEGRGAECALRRWEGNVTGAGTYKKRQIDPRGLSASVLT